MYGPSLFDAILVIIVWVLPALAVMLSFFAILLAPFRPTRIASLVFGISCLCVHLIFGIVMLHFGPDMPSQIRSAPVGDLFFSRIPLLLAVAVVPATVVLLRMQNRKDANAS
jgi:hypothetical protein